MTYTVEWTESAEGDLAAIWMAAADPSSVRHASNVTDYMLAGDPLRFGRPWWSGVHRIAIQPPLGIEFEVIEDDKKVLVHGVWFTG